MHTAFILDGSWHSLLYMWRKVGPPCFLNLALMSIRFVFTNYALISVLSDMLQTGTTDVGVHYDIMCH